MTDTSNGLQLRQRACLLLILLTLGGAGCVSLPRSSEQTAAPLQQLTTHIHFLSDPALHGRKPGTRGSRIAAHYIKAHFREYGLVPWGVDHGYNWSFGYGRNLVALLPGSDPTLSNELVVVCAHYDHLGKNQEGRICPGAADNASGVGALLELARQMSQNPERPRRSVLFASFDSEEMMLLGSFAFCGNKSVQQARIVAVVNVDMLGRDLLDVVSHTLFVAGAERYPSLRQAICASGRVSGIRVLPLGTDLIGPRGDHIAFEGRGVPCLFFTCGSFRDYHQPGDTADKLNYDDITRSIGVMSDTLRRLATSDAVEQVGGTDSGFAEELRAVCQIMSEVNAGRVQAGIKEEDAQAFRALAREAENLSVGNKYDAKRRKRLILDASGVLAPYFLPVDMLGKNPSPDQLKQARVLLQFLQEFYLNHGEELLQGYRRFVAQLLKYRPGLVRGMPPFEYTLYAFADEDIRFEQRTPDQFALNALATSWNMKAGMRSSKWLLKAFGVYMGCGLEPFDCTGSRQQIADYCLLLLRTEQTNGQRAAAIKKLLVTVTGNEVQGDYRELLQARLRGGGFNSESEWIISCILTGPPELEVLALRAKPLGAKENFTAVLCRILADPNRRADVRAAAIEAAGELKIGPALSTLCDLLHDSSRPFQRQFSPISRSDYPFSDRFVTKAALQILGKEWSKSAKMTLGDVAHEELKKVAKRDLGTGPAPWRVWLQKRGLTGAGETGR